jgi:hypothetical protein
MSDEPLYLSFDLVRVDEIIRIEKLDECAARHLICTVARGTGSGVCLANNPDPSATKSLHHVNRPVLRPVVNDHDLYVRPSLAKDRVERFTDGYFGIVARDENGDLGVAHRQSFT